MAKKPSPDDKVLILFTSEKGGAGKSFAACAFVDYLRSSGQTVAAYDSDGAIGALSKMHATKDDDGYPAKHQDPAKGVVFYNLRGDEDRAQLINSLATGHSRVVHDLAGGGLADLMRIQDAGEGLTRFLRAVRNAGFRVVFVHLLTTDDSATASVATYFDVIEQTRDLAELVSHVVMLNRKAGKKDAAFIDWVGFTDPETSERSGGKTRGRLMELGGVETELPLLDEVAAAKTKRLGIPFAAAETSRKLSFSEQQHVQIFREDVRAAIGRAKHILGVD
jgi:acetolactate synthase regulatory subunit